MSKKAGPVREKLPPEQLREGAFAVLGAAVAGVDARDAGVRAEPSREDPKLQPRGTEERVPGPTDGVPQPTAISARARPGSDAQVVNL